MTESQQNRILQTINVFETGSLEGDYAAISIYNDGKDNTRQITYGKAQTTEQGNLKKLLQIYIQKGGVYADQIAEYLPVVGIKPLVNDVAFIALLKQSGEKDHIMQEAQDLFFERMYFQPAMEWCDTEGFTLPLSKLVIYDSFIHSGSILPLLRNRFAEKTPIRGGSEKMWITLYINERKAWLKTHRNPVLQKTVYRCACFQDAIKKGNWYLTKPLNANGVSV